MIFMGNKKIEKIVNHQKDLNLNKENKVNNLYKEWNSLKKYIYKGYNYLKDNENLYKFDYFQVLINIFLKTYKYIYFDII